MKTKQILTKFFLIMALVNGAITGTSCDSEKPTNGMEIDETTKKAGEILAQMSLEEKVAQTLCVWQEDADKIFDESGQPDKEKIKKNFPYGLGQIGRPSYLKGKTGAKDMAELTNTLQKIMMEISPSGIPVIFHEESLHGHAALEGTSFPQPIGLASTFDPELVQELYTMAAKEIRKRGGHQALTPVVDVARDPRWGRVEETFGEDPYLVSEMGVAAVKGFQGNRKFENKEHVIATLKHFAAHGQPESGTNCGPVNVSERVLREVFFPPFYKSIKEAGAMSVMASYNEIDAIPSHANKWLLQDVLRKEWGFDGVVVSDYYAITELYQKADDWGNWVAEDKAQAAKLAIEAGVNIELPRPDCYPSLTELVKKGKVDEATLDKMVLPMLVHKIELGLFEEPYVDPEEAEKIVNLASSRELALKAALRTITLLENKKEALPLNKSKVNKVAVIGPNADRSLLGGYSGWPQVDVSLLEGIKEHVGNNVDIVYAEGCKITTTSGIDAEGNKIASADGWNTPEVGLPSKEQNDKLIEEAVAVAKHSDVIVLAIGGNEQTSREAWAYNHMGDRTSLTLFGRQMELFNRLKTLNIPVIVVLNNGRPLAIGELKEKANAILECWYLGQESGRAIAQVIFGEYNPAGRLPISFPRSVGHIPAYYNHKPFDRRGYLYDDVSALYPFGYGLSYTKFSISEPKLSSNEIRISGKVNVAVEVENIGKIKGDEVVQLYIRDEVSSVTRPVKELKGFKRISLEPGEKKMVTFELGEEHFAFWDINMNYTVEPGKFKIMLGPNSQDLKTVELTIKD